MSAERWPLVLGLVPARGGSESVPGKNLVEVGGRPLIAWTIEAANRAASIDRVVVTTDSEEIAAEARRCGAEAPFLRPEELARADTPGIEAVLHAVRWLEKQEGYRPDWVMLLQPTSPLREPEDIDGAVRLALEKRADAVVGVCDVTHHPYWAKAVAEDGRLVEFLTLDREYARRQDLPAVYGINGAIYAARRQVLLDRESFYTDRTWPWVMPPDRSLDVNIAWDVRVADLVLRERPPHEAG